MAVGVHGLRGLDFVRFLFWVGFGGFLVWDVSCGCVFLWVWDWLARSWVCYACDFLSLGGFGGWICVGWVGFDL